MFAFRPLEMLERKIIPRHMPNIQIQLNPPVVNLDQVEPDTKVEPVEIIPLNLKIVDKRRSSAIDRAEILDRLRNKSAVQVIDENIQKKMEMKMPDVEMKMPEVPEVEMKMPEMPVKTTKRLVIRPPVEEIAPMETTPVITAEEDAAI
jgi:hypothetical protein